MDVRSQYINLRLKNVGLDQIDEVIEFKNYCKKTNNFEYFFLSILLIIDIYINEKLYKDALNIAFKYFDDVDPVTYQSIYISYLDRLIYICIQKKNYLSASRYANQKRLYLDANNVEEINRWYLEMAYIHDALGEKNKSLSNFSAILGNNPDKSLELIVLNNITKLYIDSKNIGESKNYLNKSMSLAYEMNDEEAQIYCQYLNAKLYSLEGKNRFASKLFYDIFRGKEELNDEYIGYLNKFIEFLNENEEYNDAKKIANKFLSSIDQTQDLYLKKDFYKHYLKSAINSVSNIAPEVKKMYSQLLKISDDIVKSNEIILNEANEDDKNTRINESLSETINKIEKITNLVNYSMIYSSERECLFEFCKNLEMQVTFNEATFVIFNRAAFESHPKFLSSYSKVRTFQYKKQRMYERELSYNDLNDTIIEMLITGNKDITIDFTDTSIPTIDVITGNTYLDLKIKYLYATPLIYEGDLYACVVYTSNNVEIINSQNLVNLKIASRLIEAKLVNLYYQESLKTQKNILQIALDNSDEGMYYLDPKGKKIELSSKLSSLFKTKSNIIHFDEYLEFVKEKEVFANLDETLSNGKNYCLEYNLLIDGKEVLIRDQGTPYFTSQDEIKFYVSTIEKIKASDTIFKEKKFEYLSSLRYKDLSSKILSLKESEFSLVIFKILNDQENLEKLYRHLQKLTDDVYMISIDKYAVILDETDELVIEKEISKIQKYINTSVALLTYPKMYGTITRFLELSELFKFDEPYQKMSDDILYSFNQSLFVNSTLTTAINSKEFDVLYSPLYQKNKISNNDSLIGYYISFNLKGIIDNNLINKWGNEDIISNFELILLDKLIKSSFSNDIKLYLPVSCNTLNHILDDFSLGKDMLKNIVFCIIDSKEINCLNSLIDKLSNSNLKYVLDIEVLKKVSISFMYEDNYLGLIYLDESDDELTNDLLSFNKKLGKDTISDFLIEGNDIIFFEGKMYKKDEI